MTSSLPGSDDIHRVALSNGIIVLARENFNSPSINIGGTLQVGALREVDDKLGLADFCSSMLMRGTQKRTFQQLYEELEAVGASFAYKSGTHTTAFAGKALVEHLDILLDMLIETLSFPVFPEEYVERLRGQLLTKLAILAQDTDNMAALTLDNILYKGHPYSRPTDGYAETVSAITQMDLFDFQRQYYTPRGMVISLTGAIHTQEAVEHVAKFLGDWNPIVKVEPLILPPVIPLEQIQTQTVQIQEKSQTTVLLGSVGPARRDKDFLAAYVGNNILGQFGMYGRIGEVIREQEGLAYYAYSSLSGGIGPGPWVIQLGTSPENVEKAIQLLRNEVKRFTEQPVSKTELEDSQSMFIGALPLSLESNEGMAFALLNIEKYQLELDYYRQFPDLIRAVTPRQILEAARTFLHTDKLGIAIAGS